jgi:hypothetical protein
MAVVCKGGDESSDSIKARALLMWADINFQNRASAMWLTKACGILQLLIWLFRYTMKIFLFLCLPSRLQLGES